jgi:hypothetical protein
MLTNGGSQNSAGRNQGHPNLRGFICNLLQYNKIVNPERTWSRGDNSRRWEGNPLANHGKTFHSFATNTGKYQEMSGGNCGKSFHKLLICSKFTDSRLWRLLFDPEPRVAG